MTIQAARWLLEFQRNQCPRGSQKAELRRKNEESDALPARGSMTRSSVGRCWASECAADCKSAFHVATFACEAGTTASCGPRDLTRRLGLLNHFGAASAHPRLWNEGHQKNVFETIRRWCAYNRVCIHVGDQAEWLLPSSLSYSLLTRLSQRVKRSPQCRVLKSKKLGTTPLSAGSRK